MQASRTALKVISILLIIFAILSIVVAVALFMGTSLPGLSTTVIDLDGQSISGAAGAMALGIIALLNGIIYLVIGSLGLRGAKHPKKIGAFFWLSIIGLVLAIMSLVSSILTSSSVPPLTIVQIVLILVCIFLAYQIRSGNKRINS